MAEKKVVLPKDQQNLVSALDAGIKILEKIRDDSAEAARKSTDNDESVTMFTRAKQSAADMVSLKRARERIGRGNYA